MTSLFCVFHIVYERDEQSKAAHGPPDGYWEDPSFARSALSASSFQSLFPTLLPRSSLSLPPLPFFIPSLLILFTTPNLCSSSLLWQRSFQPLVCSGFGDAALQGVWRLPGFVTAVLTGAWSISSSPDETLGKKTPKIQATGSNPHNHLLNPAATPKL